MTCIMDQVYPHRQPVWSAGGGPSAVAIGPVPMEMLEYYPPPFSSPPATPMTPVTPATPHPNMFSVPHAHLYTDHPGIYTAPVPSHHPPHLLPVCDPAALEYRMYALCQHLHHCVEVCSRNVSEADRNMWWEHFFGEHFQENARLSIEVDTTGKGMRKHCLRSEWIMWFFRTMLENGVSGVSIQLGHISHSYSQNNLQQLECRGAVMETDHTQPHQAKVSVVGNMVIEFTPEEKPRIIMWYFQIQNHVEYISRSEARQLQEQGGVATDFTIMGLIPSICKLLASAESMDTSFSEATLLHHPTSTSTGMLCPQWQRSTHMEPVMEGNGLCSIPLSPTSQAGISSTVGSTLSPPPCMGKPKMVRTSSSSHKKQRTSPVSKRSYILIAPDAQPFTDDMVHGLDERMITRVDSKKVRRSLSSSSESKEALTPLPVSTQPPGQLGPAVWPNGCLDQPPVADHNGR